jgi:hypothetical protein
MRSRHLLAAIALVGSNASSAAPLNTWGEHIGNQVFALTPYVYAGPSFGVQPWVYGEWGFTDHFELAGAVAATVAPGQTFDAVELMPRYFFSDSTGLALRMTWTPATASVTTALELHGVYEFGSFALTLNPSWAPVATADGFDPGTIGGIVAPEWFFTDNLSVFVELTPTFMVSPGATSLMDRLSFEVLPGVGFTVFDVHQFSMGVGIPLVRFNANEIYGGLWYSVTWGGEEETAPAPPLPSAPAG